VIRHTRLKKRMTYFHRVRMLILICTIVQSSVQIQTHTRTNAWKYKQPALLLCCNRLGWVCVNLIRLVAITVSKNMFSIEETLEIGKPHNLRGSQLHSVVSNKIFVFTALVYECIIVHSHRTQKVNSGLIILRSFPRVSHRARVTSLVAVTEQNYVFTCHIVRHLSERRRRQN